MTDTYFYSQLEATPNLFLISEIFKYLKSIHPDLYAYTSKEETYELVAQTKSLVKDSINAFDLWVLVAPIVDNLKHGHTILANIKCWNFDVIRDEVIKYLRF